MKKIMQAIHPDDQEHLKKMGLKKDEVMQWEDGMRTSGKKGTYEWWYSDFSFSDGTKLVIVFYTKNPVKINVGLKPLITMELTLPDGSKFYDQVKPDPKDCIYSKDRCWVINGDSRIEGDLYNYEIVFRGPKMSARVNLWNTIRAWRSQSGSLIFGDDEEYHFSWLPAVPEGDATADIEYPGGELHLEGSGYHDHNWGNISMFKLMHHWYWGRAKIGDYKVIASWITAREEYGYKDFDIFMLAKGSEILGDNSNHTLKFLPEDEYIDKNTKKPVYGKVIYEYETPSGELYRITFDRKDDISREFFYESLPKALRPAAKAVGFKGSYQRFAGIATVERIEEGRVVEKATEDSAVWELMYFGKAGADKSKKL
ncbi:MAG: hydroxyneurosporene dehydrogenase [Firmicutes bacterium]|nr:hydroxyneurosporene dehydrogenase [Bacillota bacterium]